MDQKDSGTNSMAGQKKVLLSQDLLKGERFIYIQHEPVCYRLMLTRNGRLILNK